MPAQPNTSPQSTGPARSAGPAHSAQSARERAHARQADRNRQANHIRRANHLLALAAKGAWHMTKFLAGIAIRIPGWFVRANKRHT